MNLAEACELLYYDIVVSPISIQHLRDFSRSLRPQIATYAQLREQHAYYIKVVAGELPPGEAVQPNRYPFYEVPFQMVAADEAQMMKNPNGQTGAAVLALLREFTLLLSATLIQVGSASSCLFMSNAARHHQEFLVRPVHATEGGGKGLPSVEQALQAYIEVGRVFSGRL